MKEVHVPSIRGVEGGGGGEIAVKFNLVKRNVTSTEDSVRFDEQEKLMLIGCLCWKLKELLRNEYSSIVS